MTRLQQELSRLYLSPDADTDAGGQHAPPDVPRLIDRNGGVRALVLELARPADWAALSKVWSGVQADLDLPAPAIAVSGRDGYQLWFSLAEPLPVVQVLPFLEGLRSRYLSDIRADRIGLLPSVDAVSPLVARHARPVPAQQADSGLWSAFVAPDLAPVFAEEPWLDLPPNPEGQSTLLSRLSCMGTAAFRQALQRLAPAPAPAQPADGPSEVAPAATGAVAPDPTPTRACDDPKRFLLGVMNNESVALGLRIEAAKALLPWCTDRGGR